MGNSASLVISTDESHYVAGDVVTGTVYLDVAVSEGIAASSVHLQFRGEEISSIGVYRANETFHEESKGNILTLTVQLTKTSGRVDLGQYEFPFDVELPDWLPSSMICEGNGDTSSHCDIVYTLEAYMAQEKNGRQFRLEDPVATRRVFIAGKPTDSLVSVCSTVSANSTKAPPVPFSETFNLMSLFCYPRGRLKVEGELTPSVVRLGGKLRISFAFCNESKADIKGVEVQIKEYVSWRAGAGAMSTHEKIHRVVAEKSIQSAFLGQTAAQHNVDGVDGAARVQPLGAEEPTRRPRNFIHAIQIPFHTRPSYEGEGEGENKDKLIEIKHELVASVGLQGCAFLTTNPQLRLPLKIQPPSDTDDYLAAMSEPRPPPIRALIHGGHTPKTNPFFSGSRKRGYDMYHQRIWYAVPSDWSPVYVAEPVVLDLSQAKMGGVESSQMF